MELISGRSILAETRFKIRSAHESHQNVPFHDIPARQHMSLTGAIHDF